MIITNSSKPFTAIGYSSESLTFTDLKMYMMKNDQVNLDFMSVDDFKNFGDNNRQYINLITNSDRAYVSELLDNKQVERFTFIHNSSVIDADFIGTGCFIYPTVTLYPKTKIDSDVIIHANTVVAHNSYIGRRTFVSGGARVSGSVTIGNDCWIGVGTFFFDKVKIAPNVTISGGCVVRKNITESGTYGNLGQQLKKLQ